MALPQYSRAIAKTRAMEAVQAAETFIKAANVFSLSNPEVNMSGQDLYSAMGIDMSPYENSPRIRIYTADYTVESNGFWAHLAIAVSANLSDYYLEAERYRGSSWIKFCLYKNKLGESVCENLKAFGYMPVDDRPDDSDPDPFSN